MSKQSKSQWDFGELFPMETTRRVLSVGELTAQVRRLLEKQVGTVWVSGEVANLRAQSSGHIYFTVKDAVSQLSCVLFGREKVPYRELLADGQKVVLQGDVTVYETRGQYQLIVCAIELQGVGALQLAFEKLKQKLAAEGFFAPERKRELPKYPQRIGLVTSPTGAAIRDVLHVIRRRAAALKIILVPCRVQGDGAAEEIAAAIRLLNEWNTSQAGRAPRGTSGSGQRTARPSENGIDLILITRGGGSLEDLWAFNEEVVARAIFESGVPVVSAIGHEIDFTISDFVADTRAATPSAAAEIITEGVFASGQFVAETGDWLHQQVRRRLERVREDFQGFRQRLVRSQPRRRLNEQLQRLDDLQVDLFRGVKYRWHDCQTAWLTARQRLSRVRLERMLIQCRQALLGAQRRLIGDAREVWKNLQNRFATIETRLRLLSPTNVLKRGYSITMDAATSQIVRNAEELKTGQRLKTRFNKGEVRSVVEE